MSKVLTIVGARPQFIKASVVSRALHRVPGMEEVIIHTGQHFDDNMSKVFFDEMEIPRPAYNLGIHGLKHGAMTGRMLEKIEELIEKEQPDIVLVYGDTNSTLAGALAASKMQVKLAHVEAGLRSFNLKMPEETNRIVTDRISDLLFCPTETAIRNLENEGYGKLDKTMINCGDVMYDAALHFATVSSTRSDIVNRLKLNDFMLCTIHRAENTDDIQRLSAIVSALNKIAESLPVVLPMHPRTGKFIEDHGLELKVTTLEPVSYFDMLELLKRCKLVATDSGGLQKEAYFFQKKCVTLRNETEWVELVEKGFNKIVGADEPRIIKGVEQMLGSEQDFSEKLYGEGNASEIIAGHLSKI